MYDLSVAAQGYPAHGLEEGEGQGAPSCGQVTPELAVLSQVR